MVSIIMSFVFGGMLHDHSNHHFSAQLNDEKGEMVKARGLRMQQSERNKGMWCDYIHLYSPSSNMQTFLTLALLEHFFTFIEIK